MVKYETLSLDETNNFKHGYFLPKMISNINKISQVDSTRDCLPSENKLFSIKCTFYFSVGQIVYAVKFFSRFFRKLLTGAPRVLFWTFLQYRLVSWQRKHIFCDFYQNLWFDSRDNRLALELKFDLEDGVTGSRN